MQFFPCIVLLYSNSLTYCIHFLVLVLLLSHTMHMYTVVCPFERIFTVVASLVLLEYTCKSKYLVECIPTDYVLYLFTRM